LKNIFLICGLLLCLSNFTYAKITKAQIDYNLIRFSYIGDFAKVKQALENGANINRQHDGMNALLWAGLKNRENILKYGANKNSKSLSGRNILNYAVQNKNHSLIKYLLNMNIERNLSDDKSDVLFEAISYGDIESVKFCLQENKNLSKLININKKDRHYAMQTTYLLKSINYDEVEIAKLLVQNGVNINQANSKGETPLLAAMRNENYKTVDFLILKGAKLDSVDVGGNTLLSYALKSKNEKLAYKALDSNLELNTLLSRDVAYNKNKAYEYYISKPKPTELHYTYLHMASMYGMTSIVKELIKKGLDVDKPTSDGFYLDALGFAAFKGRAQTAIYLIKNGVDPYKIYKNIYTQGSFGLAYWAGAYEKYSLLALATISQNRSEELVQYLLSLKNAKNYINLHNDIFYMNLLISTNATSNNIINTILKQFKQWGYENKEIENRVFKIQENIRQKEQKSQKKKSVIDPVEVEIKKAIKNADIRTLKRLKNEGINIDQIVPNSLYLAIHYNQPQLIQMLIEFGADVRYKTEYSGTLFHTLLIQNSRDRVKGFEDIFFLFVNKGLDINT